MLNKIFVKIIVVLLSAYVLLLTGCSSKFSCAPGAGLVLGTAIGAAVGCPPAGALAGLALGTGLGYIGHSSKTYSYINEPDPTRGTGFRHFSKNLNTYFYIGPKNQIWLGDEKSGKWLKQRDWEEVHGKIRKGDLDVES